MKHAAQPRVLPFLCLALCLFAAQVSLAQNCSSAPNNGWGSNYSAYADWCSRCGGTPSNVGGVSCTPGPNWGKTSGGSSGSDSAIYGGVYSLSYQLGYKFGQWLFSNNSNSAQARAQQQAMMEEIARREAEAEREHQAEEAARLAAMYQRLGDDLKHRDLPDLQLKTRASGNGVTGIQGLPGMYLEGGENKPYGIQGLPGIYVGGPGEGSGLKLKTRDSEMSSAANTQPAAPAAPAAAAPVDSTSGKGLGLSLKTRDSEMSTAVNNAPAAGAGTDATPNTAPASATGSQPAITAADTGLQYKGRDDSGPAAQPPASASQTTDFDPGKMTPQQLADAADAFSKLPAEEQQKIMAGAQQNEAGGQPTTAAPGSQPGTSHWTATAAAPPPSQEPAAGAAAQPGGSALGQLQQEAASSQAAAGAASPEAASAQARVGFDTPGGNVAPPASVPAGQPASAASRASAPVSQTVSSAPASTVAAGCSSSGVSDGAVDLSCARTLTVDPARVGQTVSAPRAPTPSRTIIAAAVPSPAPAAAPTRQSRPAPAQSSIGQLSNEQLKSEIAQMRQKFVNMQGEFQADAQNLEEWAHAGEETQQEAIEAGLKCLSETLEKAIQDSLDKKQEDYQKQRKDAAFEAGAEEKWKRVRDAQWGLSKAGVDYTMSDQKREETLETAESVLEEALDFVRGAGSPWIGPAKCLVDCSYVAAEFSMIEQQVDIINDNLGSATGKLKAQQALDTYYKDLIAEQQRRVGAAQ